MGAALPFAASAVPIAASCSAESCRVTGNVATALFTGVITSCISGDNPCTSAVGKGITLVATALSSGASSQTIPIIWLLIINFYNNSIIP
jgi:hypothetical protein